GARWKCGRKPRGGRLSRAVAISPLTINANLRNSLAKLRHFSKSFYAIESASFGGRTRIGCPEESVNVTVCSSFRTRCDGHHGRDRAISVNGVFRIRPRLRHPLGLSRSGAKRR